MTNYYCFLCNEVHDDTPTREHFIPRSMGAPESQWLPVCEASNSRSNSVFDNDSRDLLFLARHQSTRALGRSGEALLGEGTLKTFKFSYNETVPTAAYFGYIYDMDNGETIPREDVYAITFPIGLNPEEKMQYCRGLAKISLGALVQLLKGKNVTDEQIRTMFSHWSIDLLRKFALNQPWVGGPNSLHFSIGRNEILSHLQGTSTDQRKRNHVVEVSIDADGRIHVEGMLYSMYGWAVDFASEPIVEAQVLRLENPLRGTTAPELLMDLTSSPDKICLINKDYRGPTPEIPLHWKGDR